jgi:cellulose synthase (UDP-forming)
VNSSIPVLLVIGFYFTLGPVLPLRRPWARCILLLGLTVLSSRYLWWRWTRTLPTGLGSFENLWMWGIFGVEMLAYFSLSVMMVLLTRRADRTEEADRHEARMRALPSSKLPSVDVLIPTYNEDFEVLERTILGAINIDYPRLTVYVLDDGKREWLRDYCAAKGVRYVRRERNLHGKAGNLNNGLTVADGDLVAVLDADFVAKPNFLYRTVGFFEDPKIGIVQTPQLFFNPDPIQTNLKAGDVWVDEQRFPFEDMQPSRDAWDCAFCCGSCSVIRRKALDTIGGFPTESVTEDVLSTLVLLRHGYVTRYLNEPLTHGLSPESLTAFYVQRARWCRGGIQTLFLPGGPLGPGLNLVQRFFFITVGLDWIIQCLIRLLVLIVPLGVIFFGLQPYYGVSTTAFLYFQLPVWLGLKLVLHYLAPGRHIVFINTATWLLICIRILPVVAATLIKPFGEPFRVTPKGKAAGASNDRFVIRTAIFLMLLNSVALMLTRVPNLGAVEPDVAGAAGLFCLYNIVLAGLVVMMARRLPWARAEERFRVKQDSACFTTDGWVDCHIVDVSLNGAMIRLPNPPPPGMRITIEIPQVNKFHCTVVRRTGEFVGVRFDSYPADRREEMIRWLYCGTYDNCVRSAKPLKLAARIARRLFVG